MAAERKYIVDIANALMEICPACAERYKHGNMKPCVDCRSPDAELKKERARANILASIENAPEHDLYSNCKKCNDETERSQPVMCKK